MPNNESVGKKIVEALKKQAENMDVQDTDMSVFDSAPVSNPANDNIFASTTSDDIFAEPVKPAKTTNFFDDVEEEKDPFFAEAQPVKSPVADTMSEAFEMPANITVLKKLISQLPSGVSRHTGAQIIKQTMEALGISMKSVIEEAKQVQMALTNNAKDCQANIIEYKKQIGILEAKSQQYQKQASIMNDIINLFIRS